MSIGETKVTRRSFIKGTVIGAAGIASAGFLAGCGGGENAPSSSTREKEGAKAKWDEAPPAIEDSRIRQTITADVVVVGAGQAGIFAACAAAEKGAKTILLEKQSKFSAGPLWMGAVDSSLQKKLGIKIDKDELVEEMCRYASHKVDQRLIKLWVDKSGEVMDWFIPIVEAGGLEVMVETDLKPGYYKSFPVAHLAVVPEKPSTSFLTGNPFGSTYYMPILEKKAKELGVDIRYKTPLVQLIRKNNKGRVTGVIAKNEKGEYIRVNAKKGVILCTGGYAANLDMMEALNPEGLRVPANTAFPSNTGDGIRAAVWVGAAMDATHTAMIFDRAAIPVGEKNGPPFKGMYWQMGSQPFLRVNLRGERFVNEDLPYDYCVNAGLLQPDGLWVMVWDSKFKEDIKRFHTTACSRIVPDPGAPPRAGVDILEKENNMYIEKGFIQKADTLDELAQKLRLPKETFKATVARYNELARKGKDEDFGKVAFRLSTLEEPPFYGAVAGGSLLCTMDGLRINTNLQVLDKELNPIPGLYAAGNDSGSFFAYSYPELIPGCALGRAVTFGRLAGQNAAAEKV